VIQHGRTIGIVSSATLNVGLTHSPSEVVVDQDINISAKEFQHGSWSTEHCTFYHEVRLMTYDL
jgi:hypothetical protein